jgi:hypothetical protein
MQKLWIGLVCLVLVSGTFAGCAKKAGTGGGDHTHPSDLDETAVYDNVLADTGFRVTGSLTGTGKALTTGADGSAGSASVVDKTPKDAGGALDKAEFLLDAKEADGTRVQAVLKSMATAKDAGMKGDFQGGGANNVQVFGTTGLGPAAFPETKAYLALFGLARVKLNNVSMEKSQLVEVFVTKAVHMDDGMMLTAVDASELEMHVWFPGKSGGAAAVPDVADGFLYYFFKNVKLSQLTPDQKAAVGSKLSAPDKANVPPVAVAQIRLPNGTAATNGMLEAAKKTLNVTLDASNSTDDGKIEAYSWDVKEYNTTGFLVPAGNQSKASGVKANFSFALPGLKQISLRVIDDAGGISNTTLFFFVDYHIVFAFDFNAQTPPAGAGTSCTPTVNCNKHSLSVNYAATKIDIKTPVQTKPTCSTPSMSIHDPAQATTGDPPATNRGTGSSIVVDKADALAKVGKWVVYVWWQTQAQCAYKADAYVYYAPKVAATK